MIINDLAQTEFLFEHNDKLICKNYKRGISNNVRILQRVKITNAEYFSL